MHIKFEYKPSEKYIKEYNYIDMFANGAYVGTLSPASNELSWSSSSNYREVRFALRNKETFKAIADELRRYKKEKGYEEVYISTINDGIATYFSDETLAEAGFVLLPDRCTMFYYLRDNNSSADNNITKNEP